MTNPIKIISKKDYEKKFGKSPNQEEVWDNISYLWNEYRKKPFLLVEYFLKGKKGLVIDLGCGSGRNMITSDDLEYYGVDFSNEQIKSAKKNIKENKINARFFKSCVDKLDKSIFKDNLFNYGLFIATLHCIENEKQRKNAIREFYRILKPGAEALISVWNSEDKRFDCVGNNGDVYMSWKENGKEHMRYYYLYSKQDFLKLIESSGFKVLEFYSPSEKDRFSRKNWIVRVKKD